MILQKGHRRGPVLLRFRSLVDYLGRWVAMIADSRQLRKLRYSLRGRQRD